MTQVHCSFVCPGGLGPKEPVDKTSWELQGRHLDPFSLYSVSCCHYDREGDV